MTRGSLIALAKSCTIPTLFEVKYMHWPGGGGNPALSYIHCTLGIIEFVGSVVGPELHEPAHH